MRGQVHFECTARGRVLRRNLLLAADCACDAGKLEYRSLRFEYERREGDFQGCATMHYPALEVPFTRIVEYKHFHRATRGLAHTIIAREYPTDHVRGENEPYYPVNTIENNRLAARYIARAAAAGIVCGGRLGTYKYLNMDQVIGQALSDPSATPG